MSIVGKGQLFAIGAIAVGVGVSQADKSMNYIEVEATVTKSIVDCYIENSSGRLVEKDSEKLAYMDCDQAPAAAAQFDYSKSDIKTRSQYEFTYVSPVDGSKQKGADTNKYAEIKTGQKIKVFAHKTEPGKSRM